MRVRRRNVGVVGAVLALSLLGAACGGSDEASDDGAAAEMAPAAAAAAPAVDSPAATLQRDLTSLLAGHEYHAGFAVYTAVGAKGNLEDPTVQAAVQALDANSQDLAAAIGSVYGDEGAARFLALWRAHIGFFVDYTLGNATNDAAKMDAAKKALDGYRQDFGAFVEGATEGGLTQEQVADALLVHVDSTLAAIDSVVAGDGKAFAKLQEAAHHLPMIATTLSGAIAEQFPEKF